MLWVKHDTNANNDAKLKRLRMKYGLEGYGLYWYCIEIIAGNIDKDNLTFELEHDAEIIAYDTGIHYERVQEMMSYMVSLDLFEQNGHMITCLKLAKRLDKSMTNSPRMREMIQDLRERHDIVSTCHDRGEERREEKSKKDKEVSQQKLADDKDYQFAEYMLTTIRIDLPSFKQPNLEKWANTLRLMRERDNRSEEEIATIWQWVRGDSFWSSNILSPEKLRKQFDQLLLKSKGTSGNAKSKQDSVIDSLQNFNAPSNSIGIGNG